MNVTVAVDDCVFPENPEFNGRQSNAEISSDIAGIGDWWGGVGNKEQWRREQRAKEKGC